MAETLWYLTWGGSEDVCLEFGGRSKEEAEALLRIRRAMGDPLGGPVRVRVVPPTEKHLLDIDGRTICPTPEATDG